MFSIITLVVCETKPPLVPPDAQVFTWEKTFGEGGFYTGASLIETYDGGYVIAGTYTEGSESHIYLLKVSISGNKLWDTVYDESIYTSGSSVVEIPDKGFVIAGKRRMTIYDNDDVGFENYRNR